MSERYFAWSSSWVSLSGWMASENAILSSFSCMYLKITGKVSGRESTLPFSSVEWWRKYRIDEALLDIPVRYALLS
jgi:hypothetical protein